ncbi:hypothetical protein [Aquiflexum gelatinilyticum]|uniref:Cellobiose phosphorylase n=1 Tax=Aquiflexum gelatinilyticum TaxID=2961943 RepID=A0A9X2PA31_9BACT|nr:hypothetical protein [Aquiflexum gelatinilyticum]MCR9016620.1 hypothetical protein [Aquiflexum gelatinilyticum]
MQAVSKEKSELRMVEVDNQTYFQILNVDQMRPFFMSIVSSSNHWLFISSNGGISAGRKNSDFALFPYYTDDKITESADITGSKSIFQVKTEDGFLVWEPFSVRNGDKYKTQRNLYKSTFGNSIIFEEINHDLNLTFQYQWNTSHLYGFVKKSRLINHNTKTVEVSLVDGIQNIVPCGVGSSVQNSLSNLVDAYKRSELDKESGLGIFALSVIIVDKPEPSEALKANIAWSLGLENCKYLLSALQLENFRKGLPVHEETDIKAEKGAYFLNADLSISPGKQKEWLIVANVNNSVSQLIEIAENIKNDKQFGQKVIADIEAGTKQLIKLNAAADGIQMTNDSLKDTRHFANSLFNVMRGGIFDENYVLEKIDLENYFSKTNRQVLSYWQKISDSLPTKLTLSSFKELVKKSEHSDFRRLGLEYLPLKFSRRHGDPSRPWNQFSINTYNESDGSKILDYQGNWRDIFQNWEALVHSYPLFIDGMIFKFLNASTFDGYNPYRVTKNGIDWERIEPDDPWSYIGYWGDHQIIYLLKFLEFSEMHHPGKLETYFDNNDFVYANVPYKIKEYQEILKNPKDTIDFDHALDTKIKETWTSLGADSALLKDKQGSIYHVNFMEKILATVLAKISNFIPEGGIWMNTQRPEWNDANNALVGNGLSMVTLYYLRRFLTFFENLLQKSSIQEVKISEELLTFFKEVSDLLLENKGILTHSFTNKDRKRILDGLGLSGSKYRTQIYAHSFSNRKEAVSIKELLVFTRLSLDYLEHTIRANKRQDSLYHGYNLMTVENQQEISVSYLSEMLEGQVAVLSSGYLSSAEVLKLLESMRNSALYRPDQNSYILYPNKNLKGFLEKNNIPKEAISSSLILKTLIDEGNTQIVERDVKGAYHFNGSFKNGNDLRKELDSLYQTRFKGLNESEKIKVLEIFEDIFNHKSFTGRSGTFFGYEGLGSIYWHMVSKLLLAVQECCLRAIESNENEELVKQLLNHYYEINEGIGIHKSPTLYGAFPTDPYSHTPMSKGVQQPGMTGQVKEDILSRFGELGVFVKDGKLGFYPSMLRKGEFLTEPKAFSYVDVNSEFQHLNLEPGSLAFSFCQVPVIYKLGDITQLEVVMRNGSISKNESLSLDLEMSKNVFGRTGEIVQIIAHFNKNTFD